MASLDSLFLHPLPEPEGSFSFDDWFPAEEGSNNWSRIDAGHDHSFGDLPFDGIEDQADSSEELVPENDPFIGLVLVPLEEPPRHRQSSSSIPDDLTLPSTEGSLEIVNTGNWLSSFSSKY